MNEKEYQIVFPKGIEKYIKLQNRGDGRWAYTHFPEIVNIDKHLKNRNPKIILDIGCGIGRASVYFFKRYRWKDALFIMADGNSISIGDSWGGIREKVDEFYNSLDMTRVFCYANGINRFYLFNLEERKWSGLEYTPDLVYSFLSIGFHYPIWLHLDELYPRLVKNCLLIFGLRDNAYAKRWICSQIEYIDKNKFKMIDLVLNADSTRESMLVLEKI